MARRGKAAVRMRECGECRACCVALSFQALPGESEFDKPRGVPCPELAVVGCGIYARRPPVCRRFQCGWLQASNLPEALRPDRCGVLFAANDSALGDGLAIYAHELRSGALDEELPQWLIGELATSLPVILVKGEMVEVVSARPLTASERRLLSE